MLLLDALYIMILALYIPFNLRFVFRKEYREILKGRFSPSVSPGRKDSIWIHAVSVGEVKSLENFISLLKAKTDRRIILSVTTPSGYRIAKEIFKDIEVINGPLDLSFVIRKFIRKISPAVIILNELEIWPNWISISDKMNIPMAVINGRISEKAFRNYRRFRFFIRRFFRKIDLYLLQEEHYLPRFIELGAGKGSIKISGNIKADEAVSASGKVRPKEEVLKMLGIQKKGKPWLLFASTHASDEEVFIPVLKELQKKYTAIIAPRHMNRIRDISSSLARAGLHPGIWSASAPSDRDILIFDKMGHLTELISVSDIVFMGGSFDPSIGGHNLYEPAVFGKKIIGGPHYNNFHSIGKKLVENEVYTVIFDSQGMKKFLMNLDKKEIGDAGSPGKETVINRSGAIKFSIREVLKFLN